MATTIITSLNSIWNPAGAAFSPAGAAGNDILTVDASGFLIAAGITGTLGTSGNGATLLGAGIWTVNVSGTVYSADAAGMFLAAGITGSAASTFKIAAGGSIYGKYAGIDVGGPNGTGVAYAGAPVTITNDGVIGADTSSGIAIRLTTAGAHTLTNTGSILGNSGIVSVGAANDTLTNTLTGTIQGNVELANGTNTVTNAGLIGTFNNNGTPVVVSSISGGSGIDTVTNTGRISGGVWLNDGTNKLTNGVGAFVGEFDTTSYFGRVGLDTIDNKGTMTGGIFGGDATDFASNSLTNAGYIGGATYSGKTWSYIGGSGNDVIVNSGSLSNGVTLFYGAVNSVDNQLGGYIGTTGALSIEVGTGGSGAAPNATVLNKGILAGAIDLGNGTNKLDNSGQILGDDDVFSYAGGSGADTITNSGTMVGHVNVGGGSNQLTNSGSIGRNSVSGYSYLGDAGADVVINSGTLAGAVSLGAVTLAANLSKLTNTGSIGSAAGISVWATNGNEVILNTSTAATLASIAGSVSVGDGTNIFTNTGGTVGAGSAISFTGGSGNDTVSNLNAFGRTATMAGAVIVNNGTNSLVNSGTIGANADGVSYQGGTGNDIVTNSGTMAGGILLIDASSVPEVSGLVINTLTNSGSIGAITDGGWVALAVVGNTNGTDTIINTGLISGIVYLQDGSNSFTNHGTVVGFTNSYTYGGGSGSDTITNTGSIIGPIAAGGGANKLINSGSIGAGPGESYYGTDGADTVENNGGTLAGKVLLGFAGALTGKNTLKNTGAIGQDDDGASVFGGDIDDTVTNSGTMSGGLNLRHGTNIFNNTGQIGAADFGGGQPDDISYVGGEYISGAYSGAGSDTISNTGMFAVMQGGIKAGDGKNMLANSGIVGSSSDGYSFVGGLNDDTVNNSGTLAGGIKLNAGTANAASKNVVTNSGLVGAQTSSNYAVQGDTGIDEVTNSGLMGGGVSLSDGTNKLVNTSAIGLATANSASYEGGVGDDTITNTSTATTSALLKGGVIVSDGANSLTNTNGFVGATSASLSYSGGSGKDTVTNTGGTFTGGVALGDGINVFKNIGGVVGVDGGAAVAITGLGSTAELLVKGKLTSVDTGTDTVENTNQMAGTAIAKLAIIHGYLNLGGGANTLTNKGEIRGVDGQGFSYLGLTGNDTVTNSGKIAGNVTLGYSQTGGALSTNRLDNTGLIAGIVSSDAGTDTITNSATGIIGGTVFGGLFLLGGKNTLTNAGYIGSNLGFSYYAGIGADTITNTGVMTGGLQVGLGSETVAATSANMLTNSGSIGSDAYSVSYYGGAFADTITNTGTIKGIVVMGESGAVVAEQNLLINGLNGKTIVPTAIIASEQPNDFAVQGGAGMDRVENYGVIDGGLLLLNGANTVVNNGTIGSADDSTNDHVSVVGGTGVDTVTNAAGKVIKGSLLLGDGPNVITNNGGQISTQAELADDGYYAIVTSSAKDTLTNATVVVSKVTYVGTITGTIDLGDGDNVVTNSGDFRTISSTTLLYTGSGKDTVTNSGNIFAGVSLGGGDDTLTNIVGTKSGLIAGYIDLGAGNDKLTGGSNIEHVLDGDGADTLNLGAGDDVYYATQGLANDGPDSVDGGAGVDTYDASAITVDVLINLSASAQLNTHNFTIYAAQKSTIDANVDTLKNFENAYGGAGGDKIFGNELANVIRGNDAHDELYGLAGNDTIVGGDYEGGDFYDFIHGGAGADVLWGGAGQDSFVYDAIGDSTVAVAGRDRIMDFEAGDFIDIEPLDSDTATPGNDSNFTYIGLDNPFAGLATPFTAAGQIRAIYTQNGYIIEGNVNADLAADFAIEIWDPTHALTLTDANFYG